MAVAAIYRISVKTESTDGRAAGERVEFRATKTEALALAATNGGVVTAIEYRSSMNLRHLLVDILQGGSEWVAAERVIHDPVAITLAKLRAAEETGPFPAPGEPADPEQLGELTRGHFVVTGFEEEDLTSQLAGNPTAEQNEAAWSGAAERGAEELENESTESDIDDMSAAMATLRA